jgi:hypothetical protein
MPSAGVAGIGIWYLSASQFLRPFPLRAMHMGSTCSIVQVFKVVLHHTDCPHDSEGGTKTCR